MLFQGQPRIMNQLKVYLPELYSHLGSGGENFLITAPSGWGKTRLALLMCNFLTQRFQYAIPQNGTVEFDTRFWVHFFDEVHLLQNPEYLYPIMDRKENVIILATNMEGNLLEPLINRCIPLVFEPYSREDLLDICMRVYPYSIDFDAVIESGHGNPREILSILNRLSMWTKVYGPPSDVKEVLHSFLGIVDGLDVTAQRYLEFLSKIGGSASLDRIASGIHVQKSLLLSTVEPALLWKGLIKISQKGRSLCL